MDNMMLRMPTTQGWCVTWETGEVRQRTRKRPDGTREVYGEYKVMDSRYSTSKAAIDAKAKALKEQGFSGIKVSECFF